MRWIGDGFPKKEKRNSKKPHHCSVRLRFLYSERNRRQGVLLKFVKNKLFPELNSLELQKCLITGKSLYIRDLNFNSSSNFVCSNNTKNNIV